MPPAAPRPRKSQKPDLTNSPVYLIAVLHSSRISGDIALERLTRDRLATHGIRIIYGDDLPAATPPPRPIATV